MREGKKTYEEADDWVAWIDGNRGFGPWVDAHDLVWFRADAEVALAAGQPLRLEDVRADRLVRFGGVLRGEALDGSPVLDAGLVEEEAEDFGKLAFVNKDCKSSLRRCSLPH